MLAPVPGRSLYEALGMHKTLALFQRVALFAGVDDAGLIDLADAMRVSMYNAGDTLVKQGDRGDTFFILLQGEVET